MGRRSKVFISYRRDRDAEDARRVRQALERAVGAGRVAMDEPGVRRPQAAGAAPDRRFAETGALVVLISDRWLDRAGPNGVRRLGDAAQLQQKEIAAAIKAGAPVLPVLLNGAARPVAAALPKDIAALARPKPILLRSAHLQSDLTGLQGAVQALLGGGAPARRVSGAPRRAAPGFLRIAAALLIAAAIGGGVYLGVQ